MLNNTETSSPESKPSKTIKQSGFGLKKKLRSGYNKRFGSIISSKHNSSQEDVDQEVLDREKHEKYGQTSESKEDKLSSLNSSSQLNNNQPSNSSYYLFRRNNSRANSRSNSLVNSLYLHNINTGLSNSLDNNGGNVSTPVNALNTVSGFTTPKMGPMTPTYPYNSHRYQNSISSFSSIDLENSQSANNSNIDLTNEFVNIFKQEYENHCMNPKITPFDQNNPPPGVVEIVYQRSIKVCKKNKMYACKINKNNINLDNNHKLYHILKHIIKENLSFNNRRNVSRANSVTSFQIDTSYQRSNSNLLSTMSSTISNVSNKGLMDFKCNTDDKDDYKKTPVKDDTFLIDKNCHSKQSEKNIHNAPTKNTNKEHDTLLSKKKNTSTNPILFSPRKLKRDSNHIEFENECDHDDIDLLIGQIHKPDFLTTELMEGNIINTNFKYSTEKDDSDLSSIASDHEAAENISIQKVELKQAPYITKKKNI
ncbi:hypothetical protein ACO0R3_000336 [Hanseniaspora guilliermondii]